MSVGGMSSALSKNIQRVSEVRSLIPHFNVSSFRLTKI